MNSIHEPFDVNYTQTSNSANDVFINLDSVFFISRSLSLSVGIAITALFLDEHEIRLGPTSYIKQINLQFYTH